MSDSLDEGCHSKRRISSTTSCSSVIIRHHPSSEVIRGHQRSSEVIRGHQRPSEVIRRTEPIEEIILRDAPVPIEIERDHKGRELEVEAYRYARGLHAKGTGGSHGHRWHA